LDLLVIGFSVMVTGGMTAIFATQLRMPRLVSAEEINR
jgi:hypothetical protein